MIYSIFTVFGFLTFLPSILAQRQQDVKITIGENTFQITYSPDTQDVVSVATNFCITQQTALGYSNANPLTDANLGYCVTPVANYLRQQAASVATAAATAAAAAAPPASQPLGDLYRVRVPVNGQLFEIRFRPDSEPFERVSADFCITNQAVLGFNETNPLTQQTLPNCMIPIARYLQASVAEYRQQATTTTAAAAPAKPPAATPPAPPAAPPQFRVRVPIDGKIYEIALQEGQYVADIARRFCIEQHVNLGYSEANPLTEANIPSCVQPIATYLQNAVTQHNQQTQQTQQQQQTPARGTGVEVFRLTVGENTFDISFNPATEPLVQVARNFCSQQASVLGVTQETFPGCVTQVAEYLGGRMANKK